MPATRPPIDAPWPEDFGVGFTRTERARVEALLDEFAYCDFGDTREAAWRSLCGGVQVDPMPDDRQWTPLRACWNHWVFDFPVEDQDTIADIFLEVWAKDLTAGQRVFFDRWRAARPSLYEVEDVVPFRGVWLRRVLRGRAFRDAGVDAEAHGRRTLWLAEPMLADFAHRVHERKDDGVDSLEDNDARAMLSDLGEAPAALPRCALIATRLIRQPRRGFRLAEEWQTFAPSERRGLSFRARALLADPRHRARPARQRARLLAPFWWHEATRADRGGSDARAAALLQSVLGPMAAATHGERLATWHVPDPQGVEPLLRRLSGMVESLSGPEAEADGPTERTFWWRGKGVEGRRSPVRLELTGQWLSAHARDRQQAIPVRTALEAVLGRRIRRAADCTPDRLLELMAKGEQTWLDRPVPKLGGRTLRQAAALPIYHDLLITLLKDLEFLAFSIQPASACRLLHERMSRLWQGLGLRRRQQG